MTSESFSFFFIVFVPTMTISASITFVIVLKMNNGHIGPVLCGHFHHLHSGSLQVGRMRGAQLCEVYVLFTGLTACKGFQNDHAGRDAVRKCALRITAKETNQLIRKFSQLRRKSHSQMSLFRCNSEVSAVFRFAVTFCAKQD